MSLDKIVRVRLAPSPTGLFHVGTARTALFNYLFAKKNGGKFILRIEDTDKERSEEKYTKDILDGLRWLKLTWDEGPEAGGEFGPYFQTELLDHYQKYLDQLLASGKAYKCFCTHDELEAERNLTQKNGQAPKYSGKCRNLTAEQATEKEQAGLPYAVRFKTSAETVELNDLIKGKVSFDINLFGDFTIVRSDKMPLFVFAVVVDDHEMQISHVLRGEEHLPNAAKHILIARALGIEPPIFGHFPLIFNPDHTKMSKRKNPVSVSADYRDKGYLSEALVNFIALLGWNPGTEQEIFSLPELVEAFSIEKVGTSPSVFDNDKLLWMNGAYLRALPLGELAERVKPFLTEELAKITVGKPELFMKALALVQERIKLLSEISGLIGFFFAPIDYPAELLIGKKSTMENTTKALQLAIEALDKLDDFSQDSTEPVLRAVAQDNCLTAGELLWAVRVALSGLAASPGTFELIEAFGKDEALNRIKTAIAKLS
jgi:glutamyl-tRNA synthetase